MTSRALAELAARVEDTPLGARYTGPLGPARAVVERARTINERASSAGETRIWEVLFCRPAVREAPCWENADEYGRAPIDLPDAAERAWRYALGAFFNPTHRKETLP